MSIHCAAVDCKWNTSHNRCAKSREGISLSWHSVMTVHEGRQEFWRCKNYEMSDESKKLLEMLRGKNYVD